MKNKGAVIGKILAVLMLLSCSKNADEDWGRVGG
jgi:hypothetical protein